MNKANIPVSCDIKIFLKIKSLNVILDAVQIFKH